MALAGRPSGRPADGAPGGQSRPAAERGGWDPALGSTAAWAAGRPQLPPLPPSAMQRRWPGPDGGAGRVVIGGAVAAGIAAAVSVPLDRPGVGWLIATLVGAVGVVAAARAAGRSWQPARIGWALVTVFLGGAGTVRAAEWLFALCLLTAAVTGSLAVAGGSSFRGLVLGALSWPVAALRSLPWLRRGLVVQRGGGNAARAFGTAVVTVLLLLVFGALFSSADARFAHLVDAVTPELTASTVIRWLFLFTVGLAALAGAAYLLCAPPDLGGLDRAPVARLSRLEWAVPVVALDLLFGVFVAVQFAALFGGSRHVLAPGGPDFAQYARGGFWQLLMVTMLTLLVLAAVARWAPRKTAADRILLRAGLGALAALALVVVGSALHRMHVYEQAYGFTRLRLVIFACELWLGLVFGLVLAAGVKLRGGWVPRAVLATAVATLVGLVVVDPDRFVAERNVDRYAASRKVDLSYLSQLSADAVPALDRLPADRKWCVLSQIARNMQHDSAEPDWRSWNLARARAERLLVGADGRRCDLPGIVD